MIRRPPRSTLDRSSAASDVYKRQDYFRWDTQEEKARNLVDLKNFHGELGWKLLLNSHTYLEKDGEKIGLIGVENWSSRMNFHRYGDMEMAMAGMEKTPFTILLSHDPSHWDGEITAKYKHVDLTLSGHTHGFQFGVEIPGFKWSPVQYLSLIHISEPTRPY